MSKDNTAKDEPVLGYEYDGITEYDNPCPTWLMYIFYATIFFSVFYLGYHFGSMRSERLQGTTTAVTSETGMTQVEEKQLEMSEAQLTALLNDPVALAKGKEVYASKCSSCHGEAGEGLIGPNLVDNYWLHGSGETSEIANIIISGIPNTGMAAWRGRIPEENILQIAAYIKSIKGTQPENPREPEGELIEE